MLYAVCVIVCGVRFVCVLYCDYGMTLYGCVYVCLLVLVLVVVKCVCVLCV